MCSSNIAKELDKAAVEHEALVREVEIDAHHEVAKTPIDRIQDEDATLKRVIPITLFLSFFGSMCPLSFLVARLC